jgi:septal ring factor EnvC (AmiA/AmiB activator)
MIELLLGISTALIGAVVFLFNKNKKLESDKKLFEIEKEDTKLKTEQKSLQEQKKGLQQSLQEVDNVIPKNLSDSEIEEFWKGRKK